LHALFTLCIDVHVEGQRQAALHTVPN
jgi:hypothetical protein